MGPGCFVHGGVLVVVSWLWCCCLICLILCLARSNLGWSFGGWYSWMVGLVVSGCCWWYCCLCVCVCVCVCACVYRDWETGDLS